MNFFFIRWSDFSLFNLIEEELKRCKEITKNFGNWEGKILDIESAIIHYYTFKKFEKEGLISKEEIKKNKLQISKWKLRND